MSTRQDGLNSRLAAMLQKIETALLFDGRAPTIRELGESMNVRSTSYVSYLLRKLEDQRLIECSHDGTSRGIRVVQKPPIPVVQRPRVPTPILGIPILGRIAAGAPLDRFEDGHVEHLDLGAHVRAAESEDEYALEVRGDSMVDDRIFDGDYILVRPTRTAPDGAIVVALHRGASTGDGAATVKRFYLEWRYRRVRLQPANAALDPRYIPAAEWDRDWEIQGIVTAIYHPFSAR
jgi:repressor LexA